jgi:hypothetical protein
MAGETGVVDPTPNRGRTGASERESGSSGSSWLKGMVVGWIVATTLFHLISAWKGHSLYRDIHLGTALNYAKGPVDILRPIIVGFNLNGAPTPQELPVWQALAGFTFKLLGTWFGWANLVSLILFFSCLYPLFRLSSRFIGEEYAWWTLVLFLAQPLIVIYAGTASPDGFSLAAAIWFLFFAAKIWERPSALNVTLAALTGALAAVSKLPFFMPAGLACFFMTLQAYRRNKGAWIGLAIAGAFTCLCFLIWTKFENRLYDQAELPFVDLRLSEGTIAWWYFGDLKYRLNPFVWGKGGWRALDALFGSFALVGVFLLGLRSRLWQPRSKLALWWLLGGAVTTFIFFHIVLHHNHYYLLFAPAVAMVCAPVAAYLERAIRNIAGKRSWFASGIIALALALATVQGMVARHIVLSFDRYPPAMARIIKENTTSSEKLVMEGGGWGGDLFILSGRQGLTVWDSKLLEDPATYSRLKSLGYTKLVMVSESPLMRAVEHSISVSPTVDRESYRQFITPIVKTFPTVLETDDILIKQLP